MSKSVPITRKFKKDIILELLDYDIDEKFETDEGEIYIKLVDDIFDKSRWSILSTLVFSFEGKLYSTPYSTGATEYQDERPFQYDKDFIQCYEVERKEKTTYYYETKKENVVT